MQPQSHTIIPLATRPDCNPADLSCQTESPGLHLSIGSSSARVTQDATSLSFVCGWRPAHPSVPTTCLAVTSWHLVQNPAFD